MTILCRKCGGTLPEGVVAFGSKETGYEHPFGCPETPDVEEVEEHRPFYFTGLEAATVIFALRILGESVRRMGADSPMTPEEIDALSARLDLEARTS